ncbi:MAG TPA: hypothetical protein VLT59_12575, partial [Steroidobacteraceae bacterium]|nr:hypothetical protein [Steroidobacteraceae bacterium]
MHEFKTVLKGWIAVAALFAGVLVHAQTAEQIEIFNSLPPDQQQAILEALGTGQGGDASRRTQSRTTLPQLPRRIDAEREAEEEADRRNPRLRPGDTLLVELKLLEYEGEPRILVEPPQNVPLMPTTGAFIPGQLATGQVMQGQAQPPQAQAQPPEPRVPIQRLARVQERLEQLQEQVRRGNPFRLDQQGYLHLPGVAPIVLAGLTAFEAAQRLAAEPFLKDFAIDLVRLPVEPAGPEALKPFGYELFRMGATTFAPVTDIPVPAEYVLGPGDTLRVQLLGNARGSHSLTV